MQPVYQRRSDVSLEHASGYENLFFYVRELTVILKEIGQAERPCPYVFLRKVKPFLETMCS